VGERRSYRLGRRQAAVDRTRAAILAAARELVARGQGEPLGVGDVAKRAGVSRVTVYNRFGSQEGLLQAVASDAHSRAGYGRHVPRVGDPQLILQERLRSACEVWASDPALFRRLPPVEAMGAETAHEDRALAEQLAASDRLRPGCSLKEAEDVIVVLSSFATFDRLHKDGRRSTSAVAEILMRLAAAILRGNVPLPQGAGPGGAPPHPLP